MERAGGKFNILRLIPPALFLGVAASTPALGQLRPSESPQPLPQTTNPAPSIDRPTMPAVQTQQPPRVVIDQTGLQLARLNEQVAALTAQVQALQTQTHYLDQQRGVLLNAINGLTAKNNDLSGQLEALETQTQYLDQQRNVMLNSINGLSTALTDKISRVLATVSAFYAEYKGHGHILNGRAGNGCTSLPVTGYSNNCLIMLQGSLRERYTGSPVVAADAFAN